MPRLEDRLDLLFQSRLHEPYRINPQRQADLGSGFDDRSAQIFWVQRRESSWKNRFSLVRVFLQGKYCTSLKPGRFRVGSCRSIVLNLNHPIGNRRRRCPSFSFPKPAGRPVRIQTLLRQEGTAWNTFNVTPSLDFLKFPFPSLPQHGGSLQEVLKTRVGMAAGPQ